MTQTNTLSDAALDLMNRMREAKTLTVDLDEHDQKTAKELIKAELAFYSMTTARLSVYTRRI